MKSLRFLAFVSGAFLLAACGAEQQPLTSNSNYLLIGPGNEGLIYRAKNDSVNVCEKASGGADKSSQRERIKIGMKVWWDALEIEEKPITFDAPGKECDITIEIKRGVHAHVYPGKRPKMAIDGPNGRMGRQRVINHEFGHAFGLDDTYAYSDSSAPRYYSEDNRCKRGQPEKSIMCNPERYGEPQDDDIKGVKHAFRNVHGSN